ncbi:hypothetical protein EI77_01333 [Prosthecobacter fusiformis]|uniref:Tetratricopeptide repeat protein n=1 Tax=Prosthecobacter fusiformis TaxID=48464 RepID=A0A4R7S6N9_9BACT|nr:hypothetical protein [Prosthecobacter fusiformis]TDU72867.1 hypothetical protein EI77_01333 [Prosthecobacter fusiformis]
MSSLMPDTPSDIHAEASRWTLHGISLLEKGDHDSLQQAQICFEHAIALRENLSLEENPLFRWGLTAGWMNRGDVLTRLGGPERLQEALGSYDIAIAHLHQLPLDRDPVFRWRLCVAWMNRGVTEQAVKEAGAHERALRCFDKAIETMHGHESSERADYQQVQASAWMNRANELLQSSLPAWLSAVEAARHSLDHCRHLDEKDLVGREAGIKARHTLCRALASLLEAPSVDSDQAEAWILEATDAVEDVMRLTQADPHFQQIREEMFHFGCRMYRAFQPHFLAGFLDDGMMAGGMSEEMRQAAREALAQAAFQIQQENLAGYTPSRLDRLLHTLQSLSEAGEKLGFRDGSPPGNPPIGT